MTLLAKIIKVQQTSFNGIANRSPAAGSNGLTNGTEKYRNCSRRKENIYIGRH